MTKKIFRIIVVEDERLIARNIKNTIERCGEEYMVTHIARDGLMGLELVRKHVPDLVITDIKMPEMDGLALLEILAQEFPQIKTIIISGYADFEYAKVAIENNAANYLLKPVDEYELKEILTTCRQEYLIEKNKIFKQEDATPKQIAGDLKKYLLSNYADEIRLSEIANELGYSPSYLTKIFKNQYEISPSQFLRKHRMDVAKQLLSDSDYLVAEVAKMVGITDPFYFSKIFKEAWGVSPSEIHEL